MNSPAPRPSVSWRRRICHFILTDLPTTVQAEKKYVLWAHALFFIPALCMIVWVGNTPSHFNYFADETVARNTIVVLYQKIIEASLPEYLRMIAIHLNHIMILSLQFIVGGFLFGIGTLASLIHQGLYFGSMIGLFMHAPVSWLFVHDTFFRGGLELLSMMLAGAAGLRIGTTLLYGCMGKGDVKVGLSAAFTLFLGAAFFFGLTIPTSIVFYPLANAPLVLHTLFNLIFWVVCYAYVFWPRPPLHAHTATDSDS